MSLLLIHVFVVRDRFDTLISVFSSIRHLIMPTLLSKIVVTLLIPSPMIYYFIFLWYVAMQALSTFQPVLSSDSWSAWVLQETSSAYQVFWQKTGLTFDHWVVMGPCIWTYSHEHQLPTYSTYKHCEYSGLEWLYTW